MVSFLAHPIIGKGRFFFFCAMTFFWVCGCAVSARFYKSVVDEANRDWNVVLTGLKTLDYSVAVSRVLGSFLFFLVSPLRAGSSTK